jgi:hypothetical protein
MNLFDSSVHPIIHGDICQQQLQQPLLLSMTGSVRMLKAHQSFRSDAEADSKSSLGLHLYFHHLYVWMTWMMPRAHELAAERY